MKFTLMILCLAITFVNAYDNSDIVSARIESCRGCSLNRLPQVKRFVMDDAPKYERVDVKFINGAKPEFVLLGENDRELERLPLSELTREECNDLVESRGFSKKSSKLDL